MTTRAHFPILALGAALLLGDSVPALAQTPAPRPATGRSAPKPAATRPAPAAPATPPAAAVPVVTPPPAPVDPRVTIALFGENQVQGSQPWMRSTLAATFENKLVQARRFRVVSMANAGFADAAAAQSGSGLLDPNEVVRLGKQVQARYALVLRQTRAQRKTTGFGPLKQDVLEVAIQAQVQDLQTNLLSESITYEETLKTGLRPTDGNAGPVSLAQADFGKPYGETIGRFADQFITTAASNLMPLETLVADVSPGEVIIAAGSELGLASGAEFEVMKEGAPIRLPDGSEIKRTSKAGRLRVTRVESRVSYAELLETYEGATKDVTPNPSRIERMMLVRYVPTVAAPVQKKKR